MAVALLFSALALLLAAAPAVAAKRTASAPTYVTTRLSSPARTVVSSGTGQWLATFTDGSRSVALSGPSRTFAEPSNTTATVTSTVWVRLLAKPFDATVPTTWLTTELADTGADLLAIAMQYTAGAPARVNSAGIRYAGDSDYGPLQPDGTRAAGSDFNDFLGVAWSYASGTVDQPESAEYGAMDCSGFMRMVFGYRSGATLSISPATGAIPRHSWDIAASAPGILLIANTGKAPASRSALQPGDLVFFDASTADSTGIDHVGMYLGRDSAGHDRFISSRKTANGPTLGDVGGASILDGAGYYASAFRSARRT